MSVNAVGSQGSTGAINDSYAQNFKENEYTTNSFLGNIFDVFMDEMFNEMCEMSNESIYYSEDDE